MAVIWLFLIFVLKLNLLVAADEECIVTIPDGTLEGSVSATVEDNNTYCSFRGIPYAKEPVGDLRFANPVQNEAWSGTLNATEDQGVCTQTTSLTDSTVIGTEDCLYINVYTTDLTGSLPVMVFIHGGGFYEGSSTYANYAPDYLLDETVIFVSFNYRLGVFGFLSTEDTVCPGNYGLKDQVLALEWVQANIQYFGGDPSKVTIFGQSAGSASVSYLLQSDKTAGLYTAAIMESGTSLCLWALTQNARERAFSVGVDLGIVALTSQTLITELRKVDYAELRGAQTTVTTTILLTESILAGLPFGVVKEPTSSDAIVDSNSIETLNTGNFQTVPMIIGYNSYEGVYLEDYISSLATIFYQYDLDRARLAPYDLTQNILKRTIAGNLIRNKYFNSSLIANQPAALTQFITIDQFNRPIRETVRLTSAYTPVYYYEFSYEDLTGGLTYEGVGHAEELDYIFVRSGYTSTGNVATRQKVVTLWTNFAKTGNPTPSVDSALDSITWTPNTSVDNTSSTIKYLNINSTLTMSANPDQSNWVFYRNTIYAKYRDQPYTTY